jgi:hypothetical protein
MCHILICVTSACNFAITSLTDLNEDEYQITEVSKILLLYPHDCELFMKMMITFRDLLEEMTKCKVGTYLLFALNASTINIVSSNIFNQIIKPLTIL